MVCLVKRMGVRGVLWGGADHGASSYDVRVEGPVHRHLQAWMHRRTAPLGATLPTLHNIGILRTRVAVVVQRFLSGVRVSIAESPFSLASCLGYTIVGRKFFIVFAVLPAFRGPYYVMGGPPVR